jgi:hypothetical protein
MSALAQALATPPKRLRLCKLGRIVATLDKPDADAVNQALTGPTAYDGGWSERDIADALTNNGHTISDSTVRDHRLRVCGCYRTATT